MTGKGSLMRHAGRCGKVLRNDFTREDTTMSFPTKRLPGLPDVVAPDGSDVRVLLATARGSMAHFELGAARVSDAIRHPNGEEIWFVLAGRGEIWRRLDQVEEVVALEPGVCVSIACATHFQFRAAAGASLQAIGVTMPPWPGPGEAVSVPGKWVA